MFHFYLHFLVYKYIKKFKIFMPLRLIIFSFYMKKSFILKYKITWKNFLP